MPISREEFVALVRRQIANTSVGSSTARGMARGTVRAAIQHLEQVNLQGFPSEKTGFHRALDRETNSLMASLPQRRWGAARKFLNIFLRGATYKAFLRRAYNLKRIEPLLEVPLDGNVAKGLRLTAGRGVLPLWQGIKRLDPEMSRQYQDFAAEVARKKGMDRVHLDLIFWRADVQPGRKRSGRTRAGSKRRERR